MRAPYTGWPHMKSGKTEHVVRDVAGELLKARPVPSALSPFIFMTDPERVPNPLSTVRSLPEGCTVIYRHFGQSGYAEIAQSLRDMTNSKQQQFLIGHDPELALKVGADGVHFRRDGALQAPMMWRGEQPDWIISMAGLKGAQDYSGDLSVLDGLLVSSIFYSKSPSAGDPIGTERLTEICGQLNVSVFALGGVDSRTAPELVGSGAAGLAGIDGLYRLL